MNYSIRCVFWTDRPEDIVAEPANKATTIMGQEILAGVINSHYRSGFSSLLSLEQNIFTIPNGINFPLYSPLFENFDKKIHQLLDTGWFFHWYQNIINPRRYSYKVDEIGPQVLTMEHITVGFLVCLLPLILSILVFFGELVFRNIDT